MGYRPEDWVGASVLGFVHPEDLARAAELLASVIDQPGAHPPVVVRTRHNDGSWRYIETTPNNLLDVPSIRGIVFNARDVTERWLAADALRQSEERFRSLVQNASDLITVIDADTMVRYQSPSIGRVLGYGPDDVTGRRLSDFLHEDDLAGTLAAIRDAMAKKDIAVAEARMRHRDGSWRDIELIGTDQRQNPAIGGFVLNMRDVSERKSLEQQLRYQALHDPLTKLANRTRFADRLAHALLRAGRTGCRVAVLFMDLDNFKGVNDSLGHSAGDLLLTDVAERIEACLRPGDTVARLGGDEFAILLEEAASVDDAVAVTRRLFESLQAPFELEGKELLVRASVGIAVSGAGGDATDADALLRDADVAMYVAKSRGKGRFEVFEESMKVSLMERMELLADLQRAVERGEFVLQYQPIFLLKSGELFGMEALVRWQHPTRGLIPPGDFISLAEESGAILELGAWVLREACQRAKMWQLAYPADFAWTMSINVSVKQLQHPSFVAEVAQTVQASGIEPHRVILEITESVMMHDVPLMMERLRELKRVGVQLAIDDFGTGYSSLSYLREFPFDLLKIDKAFIDDVGAGSDQKELTTAIIELGKTLDLELVAEGIERSDQVSRLTTLDCGLGQGFFLAEPLDLGQVESLLRELRDKRDAAA
jgi:diguanylate cyclase (GGDEF)-like protein/PAS domain S-box-containing protein